METEITFEEMQQLSTEDLIMIRGALHAEATRLYKARKMAEDLISIRMEDIDATIVEHDDYNVTLKPILEIDHDYLEENLYNSNLWDELKDKEKEVRVVPEVTATFNGTKLKKIKSRGGEFKKIIDKAMSYEKKKLTIRNKS